MDPSLTPRTYLFVDRLSKLLGLLAVTVGLLGLAGPFSAWLVLLGVLAGVATVFVEVDQRGEPRSSGDE